MTPSLESKLKSFIRDVPDFPKPGIVFKDITPLLQDASALKQAVDAMSEPFLKEHVHHVIGIESRGFIFSPLLAYHLKAGFIPVRKAGKLPAAVEKIQYELEYGTDTLEIHQDALKKGERVIIADDLLATGGTSQAAAGLVRKIGAEVIGFSFLVELTFLKGRERLKNTPAYSLIKYK